MEQAGGGRRSGGPAIASSGLTSLHSTPMRKRFRPASAVIWPFEALHGKWDISSTADDLACAEADPEDEVC